MRTAEPKDRFWAKVDTSGSCWLWSGSVERNGYGRIRVGRGQRPLVHRFAYEMLVGPIPEGMSLDHLCRVRHCVNPEHLEPVTTRENLLRGETHAARNAAKTHCPKGHEYTPENTYDQPGRPHRVCRECRRIWSTRRRTNAHS